MKKIITFFLLAVSLNSFSQKDTIKEDGATITIDKSKFVVTKNPDPEYYETSGAGNSTFKISPQMLSVLLLKNPTVKMFEATLPMWTSIQYRQDRYNGEKGYEINSFDNHVSVEYNKGTRKIEKIRVSQCSRMQIKSFVQSLVSNGFRINAGSSDLANAVSYGGEYEYYEKRGGSITFVTHSNQIVVFKSK